MKLIQSTSKTFDFSWYLTLDHFTLHDYYRTAVSTVKEIKTSISTTSQREREGGAGGGGGVFKTQG